MRALQKIRGAVERIDAPDKLGTLDGGGTCLLAQKTIFGEGRRQNGGDRLLRLAVGIGDKIVQPLLLDGEPLAAAVMGEQQAAGLARSAFGNGQARLQPLGEKGVGHRISFNNGSGP